MKKIIISITKSHLIGLQKLVDDAIIPNISYGVKIALREWIRDNIRILDIERIKERARKEAEHQGKVMEAEFEEVS